MIQEGEVFEFESRNPQPKYTRRTVGDVYAVNVEIDETLWEEIKLMPRGAILRGRLYWTLGDDADLVEEAERKLKGEYGKFWQGMCVNSLLNDLDLRQVLNCDAANPQETKHALYERFNVSSLSQISPSDFVRWCQAEQLNNLVIIAGRVAGELDGTNNNR